MARQKTEQEKELALAHKVRKLFILMLRGNEQEREIARQRLEELLTRSRRTWGDVDQLIALSVNNPEKTRDDGNDGDETSPAQQNDGKVPDVCSNWLIGSCDASCFSRITSTQRWHSGSCTPSCSANFSVRRDWRCSRRSAAAASRSHSICAQSCARARASSARLRRRYCHG